MCASVKRYEQYQTFQLKDISTPSIGWRHGEFSSPSSGSSSSRVEVVKVVVVVINCCKVNDNIFNLNETLFLCVLLLFTFNDYIISLYVIADRGLSVSLTTISTCMC